MQEKCTNEKKYIFDMCVFMSFGRAVSVLQ